MMGKREREREREGGRRDRYEALAVKVHRILVAAGMLQTEL